MKRIILFTVAALYLGSCSKVSAQGNTVKIPCGDHVTVICDDHKTSAATKSATKSTTKPAKCPKPKKKTTLKRVPVVEQKKELCCIKTKQGAAAVFIGQVSLTDRYHGSMVTAYADPLNYRAIAQQCFSSSVDSDYCRVLPIIFVDDLTESVRYPYGQKCETECEGMNATVEMRVVYVDNRDTLLFNETKELAVDQLEEYYKKKEKPLEKDIKLAAELKNLAAKDSSVAGNFSNYHETNYILWSQSDKGIEFNDLQAEKSKKIGSLNNEFALMGRHGFYRVISVQKSYPIDPAQLTTRSPATDVFKKAEPVVVVAKKEEVEKREQLVQCNKRMRCYKCISNKDCGTDCPVTRGKHICQSHDAPAPTACNNCTVSATPVCAKPVCAQTTTVVPITRVVYVNQGGPYYGGYYNNGGYTWYSNSSSGGTVHSGGMFNGGYLRY